MGNIFSISLSCDAILSRCLDCLLPRAAYVRKLEDSIQALRTSLVDLTSLKNDVHTRVENAELQSNMKRLEKVDRWIKSVETIETRVTQLVSDSAQEIEKLCCGGCCSKDYLSSYKYGKTVAKALADVKDLENKGSFLEVAAECFDSAQERPSEPTVGMDSMLDKAWKHVEDEELGIIGLYGMGGVGKTTLLNQIHNKFLNSTPPNDFKSMIWVVVSKDHKLGTVQDKIGEKIGLFNGRWKDKELEGKAEDIHWVLTKKKFVLLLDDIWEPVDISKIGVLIPNERNKSKIIFTTRSKDVCGRMYAQKKVKVECLKWEDAWNLFQEKVGKEALSVHPDIPKLAESVAKECDGLPLALIVVGGAMARMTKPEEWKYALDNLKKSAAEFSGTGNEVFTRLKFSYDNLPSDKLRSCFLYCALFPEDFVICKDDLLYYWMCEEILDDEYGNVDQAKNEAYYIIGTLVTACLLEDEEGDHVKMHDVVRDMALWVARDCGKENDRVLVYAADHGTPYVKRWKSTTNRVSCSTTNLERLVETPTSPNLLTLFITPRTSHLHKQCLTEITDGFFNYMPRLQVLNLSQNGRLAALPSGVSNLLSLQYLNLSCTGIRELPVELKACVSLKYLNLDYTNHLDFVPRNIISSFKMLKVLRMEECGSGDKILFDGEEALIEEIQGLKQLDELRLSVGSTSCFQKFLSYDTLAKKCTRWLSMSDRENQSTTVLDISSLVDMEHLRVLHIYDYPKLEAMKISCAGQVPTNYPQKSMMKNQISLLGLQEVSVNRCGNLKDMTCLIFAPKLSTLMVCDCNEMEKIIALEKLGGEENVVRESSPFGNLSRLILCNLLVLKSVYDSALPFPYLEEIVVLNCPELKKLPLNSTSAQNRQVIIEGQESWWNGLEWEDQDSRNAFLPGFRVWGSRIKYCR